MFYCKLHGWILCCNKKIKRDISNSSTKIDIFIILCFFSKFQVDDNDINPFNAVGSLNNPKLSICLWNWKILCFFTLLDNWQDSSHLTFVLRIMFCMWKRKINSFHNYLNIFWLKFQSIQHKVDSCCGVSSYGVLFTQYLKS